MGIILTDVVKKVNRKFICVFHYILTMISYAYVIIYEKLKLPHIAILNYNLAIVLYEILIYESISWLKWWS